MSDERILKATHSGVLRIGEIELQCHVLEDRRRIISSSAVLGALALKKSGSTALSRFLGGDALKPFISQDLSERSRTSIRFVPANGGVAVGYEASILPKICRAVLEARREDALHPGQLHIARQCEILMSAFAEVGFTALIDEAVDYQGVREARELNAILSIYIEERRRQWKKLFPDDFFREICRLKGWEFKNRTPRYMGKIIRACVYDRILPRRAMTEALEDLNPKVGARRKHKHHQYATDHGREELRQHIEVVTSLAIIARDWNEFTHMVWRRYPRINDQIDLGLGRPTEPARL